MTTPHQQPLLHLRFEGPAVPEGRILWNDLNQFVANLDLALERLITILETGSSRRVGRPAKTIQELSALELVAIGPGSFSLGLNLRRKEPTLPGFDSGKQGFQLLVSGIASIGAGEPMPQMFDREVLIPLREAGRVLDRGIDAVQVNSSPDLGGGSFRFNQTVREPVP